MKNASLCKGFAVAVLASSALASNSGCAAFASANAAHSHITGCVDEIGYSVFDLILAAGSTGLLVGLEKVEESPAWMLVPGTFVASGVIGAIFVHKCRRDKRDGGATLESSPAYQPVETRASDAPDATPEQLQELRTAPPGGVKLQLDPEFVEKHPPAPKAEGAEGPTGADGADGAAGTAKETPEQEQQRRTQELMKIPCGTDLPASCPAKTSCMLFKDNRGYCVADPSAP